MAKKTLKSTAPEGYKRQGSIDDENFLYLYTQLTEFEDQVKESLTALQTQLQTSLSGVISGITEMDNTVSSRLATIGSNVASQTTSLRAGIDGIIEVLNKED